MLRRTTIILTLLALGACDQNGPSRAVITDRCVAGGEAPEICKCLADESSRKLEGDMLQIVVLGAQGEETETDRLVKELPADRQLKFKAAMRGIIESCGAEGYLAAN
jgi:hypothetical protein